MKKGKVTVYQLNTDGKYVLDEKDADYKDQETDERINSFVQTETNTTEGLPEEAYNVLHTNPFLFVRNENNESYAVSIEDFYVTYKKINKDLGSIIRSKDLRNGKKKKIFKHQFKIWNNDAINVTKKTFADAEESLGVAKEQEFKSINLGEKLGLLMGILIPVFMLLNIVSWLSITNKIIKYIAYAIMGISTLGIILAVLQDIKILRFKNYIGKQRDLYKKYLKEVNKDLKKKSKKLEKYYIKGLSKKTFVKAPYPIEKVTVGGEKVNYLKDETNIIAKKCMEVLKRNKEFNGLYTFPLILSFLAWLPSVGYLIYLCVLKLIDYLK